MILIPATTHIITWQKQNLHDTATYYVQAVIRNVRTNTILDTVNLTDLGSSARFSGQWIVPQDGSGFGAEISIVKTIYEDSGYTQVSGIYGAWEDRYTIFDIAQRGSGNGGGGEGIDYAFLKALFEKVIDQKLEALPKPKELDLSEVTLEIDGIKQGLFEKLKSLFLFQSKTEKALNSIITKNDIKDLLEDVKRENKNQIAQLSKSTDQKIGAIKEEIVDDIIDAMPTVVSNASKQLTKEFFDKSVALDKKIDGVLSSVDERMKTPLELVLRTKSPEIEEDKKEENGRSEKINRLASYAR